MAELSSKRLLEACKPWLTTYCPTMDLIATVSGKESVDVWRFNGQRVFGLLAEENIKRTIEGIAWKSDGRILAVALSGGSVLLIDSFTGKTVHQFEATVKHITRLPDWSASPSSAEPSATHWREASNLRWSSHFTDYSPIQASWPSSSLTELLDDALATAPKTRGPPVLRRDLPHTLAGIDIEASLPKLSTLPPTGSDDDVFSTRTAVDSIFHTQLAGVGQDKTSGNVVDVLLTRTTPNELHLRIFDSFEVGMVALSQSLPNGLRTKLTAGHASHPLLSDHYLIMQVESNDPRARNAKEEEKITNLQLIRVELKFLKHTSQNLPLLAAKATQLQNLLRYLQQIQTQLASEVRTAFDLPSRFLGNVNEALKENDSSASFRTAAYHLIVTGDCDPRLKEWLVDEVGERGLKRWEKAVGDCLEMIRRMTSECLLPAVERCQVVLSRLEGLARFDDTAARLGLDEKDIRPAREILDALSILCEDTLRDVCVEIRELNDFMKWLRWAAEVESLEEGSERAEEMREAFSGETELRTVLEYIEGPMEESRVLRYVEGQARDATESEANTFVGDGQFYASFKQARRQNNSANPPLKLGGLIQRLRKKTDTLSLRIAETLRKSILVSHVTELPISSNILDCRIVGDRGFELHILSVADDGGPNLSYTVVNLDGSAQQKQLSVSSRKLQVPGTVELHNFKFVDDDGFVVLVGTSGDRQIIWHPVKRKSDIRDGTGEEWEVKQKFVGGQMTGGMTPGSLAVTGKRGKRAVVVSDESQMGFAVFGLGQE